MPLPRWFSLAAISVLIGCSSVAGQPADRSPSELSYWFYGGQNLTTLGVGSHGGLAVEFDRHVLSARATSTDLVFGEQTWDVALLYSRATYAGDFFLAAGTGVSVVGGRSFSRLIAFNGETGDKLDPMLGFPLQSQVAWTPIDYGSIGLYGFANVNTGQPFGGAGLYIRIGSLN